MPRSYRPALFTIALFGACTFLNGCTQFKGMMFGRTDEYMNHIIDPMPSQWANLPADEFRYYPQEQVFYNTNRGIYHWKTEEGTWEQGDRLPFSAGIENVSDYQTVKLHMDNPTMFQESFARAFPAQGEDFLHTQSEAIATVTGNQWPGE